ncbi:MAG: GntR family transcriptional regulator [Christensenellaceae bacterium]
MDWKFNDREPLFLQIINNLRWDIISGVYKPDDKIPTVRDFAMKVGVNPNTMQKALTILEEEKLIYAQGNLGRFVTGDKAVIEKAFKEQTHRFVESVIANAKALNIGKNDIIAMLENMWGDK